MFEGKFRTLSLKVDGLTIAEYCAIGPANCIYKCVFDTGAQFTAIPQSIWTDQFHPEQIDISRYQTVRKRGAFGHGCRGKRVPLAIRILRDPNSEDLTERMSDLDSTTSVIDFGMCEADLLFDSNAARAAEAEERQRQLKEAHAGRRFVPAKIIEPLKSIYIGLGGGTFRNGGLCINWAKSEAVLVELESN